MRALPVRRVSNYQSSRHLPIQSPAKRQGDGSAYSCLLTSTPHSYSRLFVRAILYPNQGLTHKRRVGVSFYAFRVLGHIRGNSAKQRKTCRFSLEIEKEFALKTEWCCSVKINRERNSVWRFILHHSITRPTSPADWPVFFCAGWKPALRPGPNKPLVCLRVSLCPFVSSPPFFCLLVQRLFGRALERSLFSISGQIDVLLTDGKTLLKN